MISISFQSLWIIRANNFLRWTGIWLPFSFPQYTASNMLRIMRWCIGFGGFLSLRSMISRYHVFFLFIFENILLIIVFMYNFGASQFCVGKWVEIIQIRKSAVAIECEPETLYSFESQRITGCDLWKFLYALSCSINEKLFWSILPYHLPIEISEEP